MTTIYDLIILDESGSMQPISAQTISGCNETIQTIKDSQQHYSDTQKHFISIFSFHSTCVPPSRYLVKNIPVDATWEIGENDYRPNGGTPLYDAIGSCLADLKATIGNNRDAIGSVTIITDGMENSSCRYTRHKVALMIDELKELGWEFHFIGANINVKEASESIHIDNCMEFRNTPEGTKAMWEREKSMKQRYNQRMAQIERDMNLDENQKNALRKQAAKNLVEDYNF